MHCFSIVFSKASRDCTIVCSCTLFVVCGELDPMTVEVELQESVNYTPLQRMRHSAAHIMAEAVLEIFPDARLAIGPAIEDGFYYDFDLPRPLTPDDLPDIEKRMQRIVEAKYPFLRDRWP